MNLLKKHLIIWRGIVLVVVIIFLGFAIKLRNNENKEGCIERIQTETEVSAENEKNSEETYPENGISRYEWMKLLCEENGMTDFKVEIPFFEDVDKNNAYFSYIQSAAEWKVLNQTNLFYGDKGASGRFICTTAMKALGEKKVQIYLGTLENVSEEKYIELAVENNIINRSRLDDGFTEDECIEILNRLNRFCYEIVWKKNCVKLNIRMML